MGRGRKNHRPDLNGVLVIDKPLGWTSFDVCKLIRRATGGAKVGHAGTLDPLATGVLVVCLGRATKRIDEIMGTQKRYRATIDLAHISESHDLETTPTPPPPPADVTNAPSEARVREVLDGFVGVVAQTPPAHSAIQIDGKRAYELARKGEVVELKARPVVIHEISIVRYEWPGLEIDVRCGKGTYIRSLARDIGEKLNTGGMLTGLIRTAVGAFTVEGAVKLDGMDEDAVRGVVEHASGCGDGSSVSDRAV
ncbi:MAG: tRNA pseudouridine(55) synthase TruB [Phycisphaerales bacterium]|nr:tRNA pseudouridine(55) synthase TruB [Phycisphaerales bacterium]